MPFNGLCPLSVMSGSCPVQGSNDVHLRQLGLLTSGITLLDWLRDDRHTKTGSQGVRSKLLIDVDI